MINIVCLQWGTKYGPVYTNRLFWGVSHNINVPFKFHCFTDNEEHLHKDIITHPLPYKDQLEVYWNKLYLFSDDINITGRIFYLDVDTIITGNIDELVSHPDDFVGIDVFASNKRAAGTRIGSGLMMWTAGQYGHVWDSFIQDPISAMKSIHPHGDQMWIEQKVGPRKYWQDLFPSQVEWIPHCTRGLPPNARVVCFQDMWKIHDCTKPGLAGKWPYNNFVVDPVEWVPRYWRD